MGTEVYPAIKLKSSTSKGADYTFMGADSFTNKF